MRGECLGDDEQPQLAPWEVERLQAVKAVNPWKEFTDTEMQFKRLKLVKWEVEHGRYAGDN